LSAATASAEAWNVAILCANAAAGVNTCRLFEDTLAALGLRVQCHVRRWQFVELGESSVFEAAVEHALDADLVILAGHDSGPMPEELQAVLAEWLIRCGVEASPLAIAQSYGAPGEEIGVEILAALRRLTDRAHVPLYTNFSDAMLVAWDLWEWKHFLRAAAANRRPRAAACLSPIRDRLSELMPQEARRNS
jgi:hypothetical protein